MSLKELTEYSLRAIRWLTHSSEIPSISLHSGMAGIAACSLRRNVHSKMSGRWISAGCADVSHSSMTCYLDNGLLCLCRNSITLVSSGRGVPEEGLVFCEGCVDGVLSLGEEKGRAPASPEAGLCNWKKNCSLSVSRRNLKQTSLYEGQRLGPCLEEWN